jgi:hypothetical protein
MNAEQLMAYLQSWTSPYASLPGLKDEWIYEN